MRGRVTKVDLQYKLCTHLDIWMSGSAVAESPLAKASIPPDVLPFYVEVGSLSNVSSSDKKLWTSNLRAVLAIDRSMIKDYLVNSPDKDYDGESLKSYKALRAYQLFEERHTHALELCPSWPTKNDNVQENPLCFVRCHCYPSQDTSKQPYRVVVCLDRRNGRPYGAHCHCVSGQGETCSHIASLLFALEDLTSRGFQKLPNGRAPQTSCASGTSRKVDKRWMLVYLIVTIICGYYILRIFAIWKKSQK